MVKISLNLCLWIPKNSRFFESLVKVIISYFFKPTYVDYSFVSRKASQQALEY
jgi:hypothetical protein